MDDLRYVRFAGEPFAPSRGTKTRVARKIAPRIARPPARPEESPCDFTFWLLSRARLDARHYRPGPLIRRLPSCLRALRVKTEEQAREAIEEEPARLDTALSAMLIGVTEFFRDPAVYEYLRHTGVPDLARDGGLRAWSAACSEGAELYSVALLLAEAGLLDGSFLLGTDCRADAIDRARAGVYPDHALRFMNPELRRKYFEKREVRTPERGMFSAFRVPPSPASWRLDETVRRHARWKVRNLFGELESGPWDLILCRNVAIYLEPSACADLWRRLAGVLRPGGLLVVGKAERLRVPGLDLVQRCVYRKREG